MALLKHNLPATAWCFGFLLLRADRGLGSTAKRESYRESPKSGGHVPFECCSVLSRLPWGH